MSVLWTYNEYFLAVVPSCFKRIESTMHDVSIIPRNHVTQPGTAPSRTTTPHPRAKIQILRNSISSALRHLMPPPFPPHSHFSPPTNVGTSRAAPAANHKQDPHMCQLLKPRQGFLQHRHPQSMYIRTRIPDNLLFSPHCGVGGTAREEGRSDQSWTKH